MHLKKYGDRKSVSATQINAEKKYVFVIKYFKFQ